MKKNQKLFNSFFIKPAENYDRDQDGIHWMVCSITKPITYIVFQSVTQIFMNEWISDAAFCVMNMCESDLSGVIQGGCKEHQFLKACSLVIPFTPNTHKNWFRKSHVW